jgi:hypothetical protein
MQIHPYSVEHITPGSLPKAWFDGPQISFVNTQSSDGVSAQAVTEFGAVSQPRTKAGKFKHYPQMPWYRSYANTLSEAVEGARQLALHIPSSEKPWNRDFHNGIARPVVTIMQEPTSKKFFFLTGKEVPAVKPDSHLFGLVKEKVHNEVTITPLNPDVKAVVHLNNTYDFSVNKDPQVRVTDAK